MSERTVIVDGFRTEGRMQDLAGSPTVSGFVPIYPETLRAWATEMAALRKPAMNDPIVQAVATDLATRSAVGILKYGTPLTRMDLTPRQWMQHLYEELLDAACYAKRQIIDMDKENQT